MGINPQIIPLILYFMPSCTDEKYTLNIPFQNTVKFKIKDMMKLSSKSAQFDGIIKKQRIICKIPDKIAEVKNAFSRKTPCSQNLSRAV
jgi:hypothetical protein